MGNRKNIGGVNGDMLRNSEQIIEWLKLEREKRNKKRQIEKEREKKKMDIDRERKIKMKKHLARLKKEAQRQKESEIKPISRTIIIYSNRFIERFIDDDDVYQSIDELKQDESGKINWEFYEKLVQQTKQDIWRILH